MEVLVVGGTGPTGPPIVSGLLGAGHSVTVLHTGRHEVDLGSDVEHVHADPHFAEPLEAALIGRRFDVVLGMYGRLAVVADAVRDRTDAFIGVTALFYRGWVDDVLHSDETASTITKARYRDLVVPTAETEPFGANAGDRFSAKAVAAEQLVLGHHRDGTYRSAILRFPRIYGPRQPIPREWSIIRRLLDGRRHVLVPDGGLLLESRAYSENAARFVLAAVAHLDAAAGEVFNVSDARTLSLREWILAIAAAMRRDVELVSVPLEAAVLTFPYSKGPFTMGHRVLSVDKARRLLDLGELTSPAEGLARTVSWLLDHPVREHDETFLNDPFDYQGEDRLIEAIAGSREGLLELAGSSYRYQHVYRHPKASP